MKLSDDEIATFLRTEAGEERLIFSSKGLVHLWESARLRALPLLIDRDEINAQLVDYLRRHGRDFSTLREAEDFYRATSS